MDETWKNFIITPQKLFHPVLINGKSFMLAMHDDVAQTSYHHKLTAFISLDPLALRIVMMILTRIRSWFLECLPLEAGNRCSEEI